MKRLLSFRSASTTILLSALCWWSLSAPAATPNRAARKATKSASAEGEEQAQPITKAAPIRIARPAEIKEASLSGAYHFYLGTTHSHSGYSGDHAKTVATKFNNGVPNFDLHKPADIYTKARTNFYDFYFVTDHSSPEQNEFYKAGFTDEHWAATKQQAEAASTPNFLALRGYEFSRNNDPEKGGQGHMNVLGSTKWNSAYAPGHTFAWLYDWMLDQKDSIVVAQFNHPSLPGGKGKNFANYAGRTKAHNEVVRLAEIWNSGENMHYVPVIKKIWSMGWKVAPTAGTDVHGPYGIENRRIRTGVLAPGLTPENIMQALKARRVYATLEPALHFEFTLNGFEMGTELEQRPEGNLKAKVFANDPGGSMISAVEIYGGKYEANGGTHEKLASLSMGGKKTAEGSIPEGYDFYYAALMKEGATAPRAFSAPIWMDNK